jgi:cell division septum initiation protein DivIVA
MGFFQRKGATRPPGTDEDTTARVLALAQQTAAQYLADAAREADRIISEARKEADDIRARARAEHTFEQLPRQERDF